MKRGRTHRQPHFLWKHWWWTCAEENLFELSAFEWEIFKDFVALAS